MGGEKSAKPVFCGITEHPGYQGVCFLGDWLMHSFLLPHPANRLELLRRYSLANSAWRTGDAHHADGLGNPLYPALATLRWRRAE